MPITLPCEHCHKEFKVSPSRVGTRKYCSRNCHNQSMSRKEKRTCNGCNNEFFALNSEVKRGGGRYCSKECYRITLSGEGNPNYKGKVERKCKECEKVFQVEPNALIHSKGKYCSKECAWAGKKKPWIESVCKKCGTTFMARYSETKRGGGKYCSVECAGKDYSRVHKRCLKCGTEFLAKRYVIKNEAGKYCSIECKKNGDNIACKQCGKEIYMIKSRINKGAQFCGIQCKTKYNGPTSIEVMVENVLIKLELPYLKEKQFWRYRADFVIPHLNIIIEADGSQHNQPKIKAKDKRRDKWFKEKGYTTIRLPESEIRKDPEAALLSKLPSLQLSLF